MTQMLNIFRKDVRHLWPAILLVLALQAALAMSEIEVVQSIDSNRQLIIQLFVTWLLLPFAWIFLMALLVLQDPLVGENSFWQTRPYPRGQLLLAKILFVIVFLNLPLFISDCVILKTINLPLDPGYLVLRQLPLFSVLIVPAFALAAISRSVSQFALFCVAFLLSFYFEAQLPGESSIKSGGGRELFWILAFPLATIPAIAIQFNKRFAASRSALAALVFLLLPATMLVTHLLNGEALLLGPPKVQAAGHFSRENLQLTYSGPIATIRRNGTAYYRIGVHVQGLPQGAILYGTGETRIESISRPIPSILESEGDLYFLHLRLHDVKEIQGKSIVRTSLDAWALNDKATYTTKLSDRSEPFLVPSWGVCRRSFNPGPYQCWAGPLRPASLRVSASQQDQEVESFLMENRFKSTSLNWGFTPLVNQTAGFANWETLFRESQVGFAPRFPVAHFQISVKGNITLPR